MTLINKNISVRKFASAADFLQSDNIGDWSLIDFETNHVQFSPRSKSQYALIESARAQHDVFNVDQSIRKPGSYEFYLLLIERYEGIGSKFKFLKRLKELKRPREDTHELRTIEIEQDYRICYLVKAEEKWIDFSQRVEGSIGLVCFDTEIPNGLLLELALKFIPKTLIRDSVFLDEVANGFPDDYAALIHNRRLFCFSGGFDDPWNSLRIYEKLNPEKYKNVLQF
jgi:hypothetical protein